MQPHLTWRDATVTDVRTESTSARTLVLGVPEWSTHLAGQHIDLRLTAPDGYQATRSYSLSSGPGEQPEITVERVDDGEVSPFIVDDVVVGDTIEVRGPIGGYFVWLKETVEPGKPLLLIGGGSGIAPLRAMWRAAGGLTPITVLYSAQRHDRLVFADELASTGEVTARLHLTRETVQGFHDGRIDADAIAAALDTGESTPDVFVCGPTAFVEAMAQHLVAANVEPTSIRTERFG
jgi:ferredoxin-NADP reductase